ncbi:MAG: addiction module antidote protein [Deltaproteobacteria bacterium]|nr:addiction module antidote protein [Deltaproteobacteria bacterium]
MWSKSARQTFSPDGSTDWMTCGRERASWQGSSDWLRGILAMSSPSVMKKTATTRYDVSEHLRTPEEMAAYLEACIEEANGDAAFIAKALGDIARAKGMSQVARDAGLSRESLYKALSGERSPGFDTILKVIRALGLTLHAEAAQGSRS